MRFYLGTHRPTWLWRMTDTPLFVSHSTLRGRVSEFPAATTPWALDSGGFTELSTYGTWTIAPGDYIAAARRYRDELGRMEWAAQQDWMVEPWILDKTGLTVEQHQTRTIDNLLHLRHEAPDVPWIPVLQGWTPDDYWRHVEAWGRAGIDLAAEPVVGIGSVCRRQQLRSTESLVVSLAAGGIRLHGFGMKLTGLRRVGWALHSSDSMAWSYSARRDPPMKGCVGHRSCANCPRYARWWLGKVEQVLAEPQQMALAVSSACADSGESEEQA